MILSGKNILAIICLAVGTSSTAQQPLTDEQYFKGNFKGIIQPMPFTSRWTDNTHFLLTRDGKAFVVDAKTGTETAATEEDKKMGMVNAKPSPYSRKNDLYIKMTDVDEQLTFDSIPEINALLSPDGNYVAYTKGNNLYTVDLKTKKETRLTSDGSDVILNGYASWLYTEEILGRRSQYRSFWWSPDSKHLAFFRTDDSPVKPFTITDANTQHGYVETVRYPKVGDKNPEVQIGLVQPEGGKVVWADFNAKDDQYFGAPYWKPDGSSLLVQWMNRKQDNLKIWEVNPANGSKKEFYNEQQKSWVDLDDEGGRITFLKNGKGFLLMSDASGWEHIYYYDMNGRLLNPVTAGKFTVTDINFTDEKNGIVYFSARGKENTARKDLYRVNINGKNLQRLTFGDYNHAQVNMSPDGAYFITTYSNSLTPLRSTLVSNTGKIVKEIGDSRGPEFSNYQLAKTELIRVKSDDGLYD
ncbi:MAG TPA: DPP IV N-terminal domain-containing protein, partial [Ferruginibacter sp.]|nr:DPP IV N-terminal domain-containing protein [Ferruginibacter sp.]